MANIANLSIGSTLRAIRASLDLTQQQLADRLGVSFTTVNRWEGGVTAPQRAARFAINALAAEAGIDVAEPAADDAEARGTSDPAAVPAAPRRSHHQAHGADAVGRRLLHPR